LEISHFVQTGVGQLPAVDKGGLSAVVVIASASRSKRSMAANLLGLF